MLTDTLAKEREILPADHPRLLVSLHNLAMIRNRLGRLAEARALLEEALEGQRRLLGPAHPDTLLTMESLSTVLLRLGETDRARALDQERRAIGEDPEKRE